MSVLEPLVQSGYSYENLDISIIRFAEYKKDIPNRYSRKNETNTCELIYVKEGRLTYYTNCNIRFLNPGEFAFIPSNTYRQIYSDNTIDTNCYILNFKYKSLGANSEKLPFPTIFSVGRNIVINELYSELSQIWYEGNKGYRLMSRVLVLQIFHELLFRTYHDFTNRHKSNRVELIKDYVHENYQRDISVEEVADIFNLNPNYLGSYFKKKTGYTLRQYINCVRVNEAKDLLTTGKYSVGGVAEQCGYQDIYYFSKVFKEIEGVPPSAYIK